MYISRIKMPASILESVGGTYVDGRGYAVFCDSRSFIDGRLVYNVTLFDELGLEVPNTTDEPF